jgi:hypothetical protein
MSSVCIADSISNGEHKQARRSTFPRQVPVNIASDRTMVSAYLNIR